MAGLPDLICFSHLRWNFVFQRPQHLMTRFAKQSRVFYIEEPVFIEGIDMMLVSQQDGVYTVTPHLKKDSVTGTDIRIKHLLDKLLDDYALTSYITWYYTPMALSFSSHLKPEVVIYDCMDELSAFKFAPPELREREKQLFNIADIVFTGGISLYEAKKHQHPNVFAFPSSIDKQHFGSARKKHSDPDDQSDIPYPRFGFCGVIDERLDIDLIAAVASLKPDWHFIMIGPVVKIDPSSLPQLLNIHYTGGKTYDQLPAYFSNWDVAVIPFAKNESTKFISPTKTPEYLAAGLPVISTSIQDIVSTYGKENLVHIADTAEEFISAAEAELSNTQKSQWLKQVDEYLSDNSWDNTWSKMNRLILIKYQEGITTPMDAVKEKSYV